MTLLIKCIYTAHTTGQVVKSSDSPHLAQTRSHSCFTPFVRARLPSQAFANHVCTNFLTEDFPVHPGSHLITASKVGKARDVEHTRPTLLGCCICKVMADMAESSIMRINALLPSLALWPGRNFGRTRYRENSVATTATNSTWENFRPMHPRGSSPQGT